MSTLVYTESARKSQILRRSLGDDITVREVPLPIYKLGKSIEIDQYGRVKLEAYAKHIAEVRQLASRYTLVIVVLPPVPFWYDIAWSLRRAMSGLSCTVRFYFPADLISGFTCDAQEVPEKTMGSFTYAVDVIATNLVKGICSELALPAARASRHLYRRSVLTALAALSEDYLRLGSEHSAAFKLTVQGFKLPVRVATSLDVFTHTSVDVACVEETQSEWRTKSAPLLLTTKTLIPAIVSTLPHIQAQLIVPALEALYCFGCMSYFDTDAIVPDSVHEWATSYLLESADVSVDYVSTEPNLASGVYATGVEPPDHQQVHVLEILALVQRRTCLAYCLDTRVEMHTESFVATSCFGVAPFTVDHSTPDYHDWWVLSDSPDAGCFPPMEVPTTVTGDVAYAATHTMSLADLVSDLILRGLSGREALSAIHYVTAIGYVGCSTSNQPAYYILPSGFYAYAALNEACPELLRGQFNVLASSVDQIADPDTWLASLTDLVAQLRTSAHETQVDLSALIPSSNDGINLDLTTTVFKRGEETYASVLHQGRIVPVTLGSVVQFHCPVCGSPSGEVVLGVDFTTHVRCVSPACSSTSLTPLTLLPTLPLPEEEHGT